MGLNPKGRDWGPLVNWDDLGKAYAGILTAWTALLLVGIVWLIVNRHLHFVRMRNLPVAIGSVVLLHVYLFKIMTAYTVNGNFSCRAEFWIMNIYLPFGIALYQANVMQLRSVAIQQSRLLSRQTSSASIESLKPRSIRARWTRLTEAQKGYVYIAIAMVLQLVITAGIYATSPILQGDWSSFGDLPFTKGQYRCRRSIAWIPSAFWQLFWAWCYGPYLLFTIRHVRDVHYWRLQTILSIVAGLPGTPLWAAALFSHAFWPSNSRWVPPMWLAPGIIVMQFVTVFFPIWEYIEHRTALRQSAYILESKESMLASTEPSNSDHTPIPHRTSRLFEELKGSGSEQDLFRMASLEKALTLNPAPLLVFAATKDFTAENIIFLIHVRDWHDAWRTAPRQHGTTELTAPAKWELARTAIDIYFMSVSEGTAEFPINIEGPIRRDLDNVFKSCEDLYSSGGGVGSAHKSGTSPADMALSHLGSLGHATDFESTAASRERIWLDEKEYANVGSTIMSATSSVSSVSAVTPTTDEEAEKALKHSVLAETTELPDVDEHLFDAAQKSVKYLVLTNTWRKFVSTQRNKY